MYKQLSLPLGEDNVAVIKNVAKNKINHHTNSLNKDNIPINSLLIGKVGSDVVIACVHKNSYSVGNKEFASLSAAAGYVTGKRRNGREFWKTLTGQSVENIYPK
jgi:hypothetical protein